MLQCTYVGTNYTGISQNLPLWSGDSERIYSHILCHLGQEYSENTICYWAMIGISMQRLCGGFQEMRFQNALILSQFAGKLHLAFA